MHPQLLGEIKNWFVNGILRQVIPHPLKTNFQLWNVLTVWLVLLRSSIALQTW